MTRTALRALTVAALSAAITLTGTQASALADDIPAISTEDQAVIDAQIEAERTGGYRCPDPADAYPCDEVVDTAPVPDAAPVPSAPSAPSVQPVPGVSIIPADPDQQDPIAQHAADEIAPQAATATGLPGWVLTDKVLETLRALFPWAFLRVA